MKSGSLLLILFFLVAVAGAGIYIYNKFIDSDEVDENNLISLFVSTIDNSTGQQIATHFQIVSNSGEEIYQGDTLSNGRIEIEIPINQSFYLITSNLEDQRYYREVWNDSYISLENDRNVELKIIPYPDISINHNGKLGTDDSIKIKLNNVEGIDERILCVRWSYAILDVDFEEITESPLYPERLRNRVDKCFTADRTNLTMTYEEFINIQEGESIIFYLVDSDKKSPGISIFEGENKEDVGLSDISYEITS